MKSTSPVRQRRSQRGATAVEFAIVAMVFIIILLGAMEMGRMLWTWNAAAEATRLGARMAVVCDMDDPDIKARMRERLPALQDSHITVAYEPAGCTVNNCISARVTLAGYTHVPIIPVVALSIPIPPFQTTLQREVMNSTGNPACS